MIFSLCLFLLNFPCASNWKRNSWPLLVVIDSSRITAPMDRDGSLFFMETRHFFVITSVLGRYLSETRIYGHLRPFFSPFGYGRVPDLFRMTNIWNGNNSEGMTIVGKNDTNLEGMITIRKEWQKSGRNDSNMEGMTIMGKEWHKVFFWKKIFFWLKSFSN